MLLEKLPAALRKPVGLTIGGVFFLLSLLAVPLSVLTLMRWFHLPWWLALLCLFALTLIPLAGRYAYFGLSLIGAWYWIDAGFSFTEAVGRFID